MQSAENIATGKTLKGGPAAVMQSAAARNERTGHVGHGQVSGFVSEQGVGVVETNVPGRHTVTETIGDQTVGGYEMPTPLASGCPAEVLGSGKLTIGEALEAAALSEGEKLVDRSDAAAIQAAEMRATGLNETLPGGVGAQAQSAASINARVPPASSERTTLGEVLSDASMKLPADKPVTREDAERVARAEMRNNPAMTTHPTGVAASVEAAARLNENADV
ncbi:unnamed protein product [Spirodela intermedia]|nr:unnamed protein product [Spirodela intermedia]CAA6667182.1 unnamed protein product [Spirodela intermedia]